VRPIIPITNPAFKYIDAAHTDIKKTFARIRREQEKTATKPREPNVLALPYRAAK